MTDDTFAAAFADDLRAYADADVRSVDAAALARALMDRPVARSTRPWGAVRLSRIGAHRRLVSVVAVMLTVALLGLAVAGSRPHESRLAYATLDGLFIAGGDGGRPTLIAAPDSVGGIETVRWAPDGRHLAAALYGRGLQPLPPGREVSHYHYVVRVLTPDGQQTGQFELFNHYYALMSWSPDSTQVAILDIAGGNEYRLEIIGVDGRVVRTVTVLRGPAVAPIWSADARSLFAVTEAADGRGSSIWRIPVDGSDWTELVRPPAGQTILAAAGSPDGRQIAYSVSPSQGAYPTDSEYAVPGETSTIDIIDLGSGATRTVATLDGAADVAAWTRDGREAIVWTERRTSGDDPRIHIALSVVALDGSGSVRELVGGDGPVGQQPPEIPNPVSGVYPTSRVALDGDDATYTATSTDGGYRPARMPLAGGASKVLPDAGARWDVWVAP